MNNYSDKKEILSKIHNIHLEMLKLIDFICRENNINYCLAFGSALGAVRHNGAIPWDDDADIVMEYEQYKKFASVCDKYFKDDYFLQDSKTEKEIPYVFSKLRKNGTRVIDKTTIGLNINEGIWIDIFLLVNACKSSFGIKIQNTFVQLYQSLKCRYRYINDKVNYRVNIIKKIIYSLPNPIYKLLENCVFYVVRNIGSKKSTNYYNLSNDNLDISIVPKTWFDNTLYMKYEDTELLIPEDWDAYLTFLYGDYMKPVKYGGHVDYNTVIFESEINNE